MMETLFGIFKSEMFNDPERDLSRISKLEQARPFFLLTNQGKTKTY